MRVVLGVAGGIAAYKACSLLRLLTEAGHDVTVVPTAAALHFVGEATWSALSGKRVHTDVWSDITEVPHVRIGQEADLVVVAPATADLLARAATGQADDLLTNVLLTARCPVVMAPAMHTEMWDHPATQANVATLTERGVHVVPPAVRPPHRPRHRPGPAARARGPLRGVRARARPRPPPPVARPVPPHPAPATSRAATSSSPPAAPGSPSTRCATSATALRQAGLRPRRGGRPPRRPRHPRLLLAAARPGRRRRRARRDRPRARGGGHGCRPRRRCRRHGRRRRRLPPGGLRRAQDQEDARAGADGGADHSAPVVPLVRNPDVLAGLVRGPGERDLAGHRRLRRRDRVTTPPRCSTTAGPSSSARAATCSSSTRWASA